MLNYWFVSRPKRKLDTVPQVLAAFADTSLNREWNGNRGNHLEYENALEQANEIVQNYKHADEVLNLMLAGSTSIGMEFGPRVEAGLLTSQRVIEEMFQDIVINGTDVEKAAQVAEDKLNDLFESVQ